MDKHRHRARSKKDHQSPLNRHAHAISGTHMPVMPVHDQNIPSASEPESSIKHSAKRIPAGEESKSKRLKEPAKKKPSSKLNFTKEDFQSDRDHTLPLKRASAAIPKIAVGAATMAVRNKFREERDDNVALQGIDQAELLSEKGVRQIKNAACSKISEKRFGKTRKQRLNGNTDFVNQILRNGNRTKTTEAVHNQQSTMGKVSDKLNRFYQRQRQKAVILQRAGKGKSILFQSANTVEATTGFGEKVFLSVKEFFTRKKNNLYGFLSLILILILLITQLFSCSSSLTQALGTISSSSWPADDKEITRAETYYTELEANLQAKIDTVETDHPDCEEFNYNIGEIGHDPTALISYLCSRYGAFVFNQDIKNELDRLFAAQYQLDISVRNETRTVTKKEQVESDGNEDTIDVTVTENVKACYITLRSTDLTGLMTASLTADQKDIYDIYIQSGGNRQFLGSPVPYNWHYNVSSFYGYRSKNGVVSIHNGMDLVYPAGTDLFAPIDGVIKETGNTSTDGKYIVIVNDRGYEITYSHCQSLLKTEGTAVVTGDTVAEVGSTGNVTTPTVHIEFHYNGYEYNPYFYFNAGEEILLMGGIGSPVGGGNLPDIVLPANEQAARLIEEAVKHLGTPYVWGGYSPSGFDCSGFVSYCLTKSGVKNTGHLTCAGLIEQVRVIPKSELQPGDLVFFQGTYKEGLSHVGIYIGSGEYGTATFIHSGDPCQFGNLNSNYWINHWYAGGRWW